MRSVQPIQHRQFNGSKQPPQPQAANNVQRPEGDQGGLNQGLDRFAGGSQGKFSNQTSHPRNQQVGTGPNAAKHLKIQLNQAKIGQNECPQYLKQIQDVQARQYLRVPNTKSTRKKKDHSLLNDYMITCKIVEAQLSKDFSTFLNPMNVFCEVKFQTSQFKIEENTFNSKQGYTDNANCQWMSEVQVMTKNTPTQTGQNPKWNETFNFNYHRISKTGIRMLGKSSQNEKPQNIQQVDFTLYKKIMLFTGDKIGQTTVHLHNASSGSQTVQLVLNNEKDEDVGKLLVFIEIQKDNTQKQLRKIQQDLQMQEQQLKRNIADPKQPGMNKDMTEDKGMPLRNHEQVHLLNERSEPQSNQQSNAPSKPMTQGTQATHVTHQTQSSALALWGVGGILQGQGKSSHQSISMGAGPGGGTSGGTAGQQNRVTQNSIMGATNITLVSNPAVGSCSHLGPLYLETTNIIPNNKIMKQHLDGGMIGVLNNQTVNNGDEEDDDSDEDEYDDDDEFQDDDEASNPTNGSGCLQIEDECNQEGLDDEINSAEEEEGNNTGNFQQKARQRQPMPKNHNAAILQNQNSRSNEMMQKASKKFGQNGKDNRINLIKQQNGVMMGMTESVRHYSQGSAAEDQENSSMLLGMGLVGMSVVATQHIREEYDEEDQEEYGQEFELGIIEETPPIVEGGASSSTGVQNTNSNNQNYGGQNTGSQSQASQAYNNGGVNGSNMQVKQNAFEEDEDDESNINSDEQDEYQGSGEYNQKFTDDQRRYNQANQIVKRNMFPGERNSNLVHPGQPEGTQQRIYQQYSVNTRNSFLQNQNMSDQIQQNLSAMSISEDKQRLSRQKGHYQSQKIGSFNRQSQPQRLNESQNRGSAQQARTANQSRSAVRTQGNSAINGQVMQRNNTQQNFKTAQAIMVPAPIPKYPPNNNTASNYGLKMQNNHLQEQQININSIEVEPSFRSRQNNFQQNNTIQHQNSYQQKPKQQLTIKRGKLAVSGTPAIISQGQIQQTHLKSQPQRTNSMMRAQTKDRLYGGATSVSNQQFHHYQGRLPKNGQHNNNHISTNINTQINQNSIFSQQTSFFNTNMPNSQIHTQEAQQNTQTNHTNDLGDINIGDIDDYDLLQNQIDSEDEEQHLQYEDEVNSEGDVDHYTRNPGESRALQNHQKSMQQHSPIQADRRRAVGYQGNQIVRYQNQQDRYGWSGQSDSRTPKKNKRRQPSQEPIIVSSSGNPHNVQNMGRSNLQSNMRPAQQVDLNYPNGQQTTIGGLTSNGLGNNSRLEQETFSMQQDTFQVDPNQQQLMNNNGVGQHAQCKSNNEIINGQFAHNGPVFDANDGLGMQNQLNFHNSIDQAVNNQASSFDISCMQQRKYIKKSKNQENHELQRNLNQSNMPISQQIQNGAGGGAQHQGNRPHTTQQIYQQQNEFLAAQNPKQGSKVQYPHHMNNNIGQSVIQHITLHSNSTDGYDQNNTGLNTSELIPNSTTAGGPLAGVKSFQQRTDNQISYMQRSNGQIKKQSDSIQIGGGTVVGGNGEEFDQIDEQHQFDKVNGNVSSQQPFLQQLNSYQEQKDFRNNPSQYQQAFQNNQSGFGNNDHQSSMILRNYVKNPNKKTRNNTQESNGTSNTGNTGTDSIDQNMFSNKVDLFSQLNNRALNHEHQLNEMYKNLTTQFQRIKKEKAEIRELRHKVKEETKRLDQKQRDINLKSQQLQKQNLNIKREKLLMNNEAQKIQVLHNQYVDVINKQRQKGGAQGGLPVEISERLNSIKVLLELVISDRQIGSKSSSKIPKSQDIGEDASLENNKSLSEDVQTISTMKKIEDNLIDTNQKSEQLKDQQDQQSSGQQVQLQQLCNMYQQKLEEMTTSWQNMQNLHIMKSQMTDKMNQINNFQSQMQSTFQSIVMQQQQIQQNIQPSEHTSSINQLKLPNTSMNQLMNLSQPHQLATNSPNRHLFIQNQQLLDSNHGAQIIQGSPHLQNIQQPQTYNPQPFPTDFGISNSMAPSSNHQIVQNNQQSFDSQNVIPRSHQNLPQYGQSQSQLLTTSNAQSNIPTPPNGLMANNQSLNLSQMALSQQQNIMQSQQLQSFQATRNLPHQQLRTDKENQPQLLEAQDELQQWTQAQSAPQEVENRISGRHANQHVIELQLSPVHDIHEDATNVQNSLQNIENEMSQRIEMPPKIIQTDQEYEQMPNEETKKQESQTRKKSKSSSSMSEFVFNPDPDFLNKINANIRINNEVGPQATEEMEMFTADPNFLDNINANIRKNNEMAPSNQDFEANSWDLSKDRSNNESDHGVRNRLNSQQYQQNEADENQNGRQELQRSDEKALQQREELISDYGTDFQIEEADPNQDGEEGHTNDQQQIQTSGDRNQQNLHPIIEEVKHEDNVSSIATNSDMLRQRSAINENREEYKEQNSQLQGGQIDVIQTTQMSNHLSSSENQSLSQQNVSNQQSQTPSSQMSVLQQIQQKLQKIGPQTKQVPPATNTSNIHNFQEVSDAISYTQIEVEMIDSGRHIAPPTVGKIKPKGSQFENAEMPIMRTDIRASLFANERPEEAKKHSLQSQQPKQKANNVSQRLLKAKKADDEEILRLINETQQAEDEDWAPSSSDYDPLNQSSARQMNRPSQVVYGNQGEIYDEPNRAVYGIKKVKGKLF